MSRKIVAIGGGENGRIKANGTRYPYETEPMDKEIIKLTKKSRPHFLFIGHSQSPSGEQRYFETMQNIYQDIFGCECKNLLAKDLYDTNLINNLIKWSDIIYEGGGDTDNMIKLWRSTGFDKILYQAWCNGKVMCGVSAGAMCWFSYGVSDSLKIQLNDSNAPFIDVECLGFINALYTPHCDEQGRLENVKALQKNHYELSALSVSNCAALEIVDNQYKIIINENTNRNIKPYVKKSFWKDDKYIIKTINNTENYKSLDTLLKLD